MGDKGSRSKTAAKRAAVGEVELRRRVRPGIRAMLADLMAWHDIEEQAEAIQLLALNADSVQLLPPAADVELLRNRARRSLIAKLESLAGGDPQLIGLAVESLIVTAHAAGPDGYCIMILIPHHEITISPEGGAPLGRVRSDARRRRITHHPIATYRARNGGTSSAGAMGQGTRKRNEQPE